MFSAGRVLIKPEGDYSPLKTYEMLDYVSYNGSSYIAKKTTTGNLPTDTEYWQLSASGAQSQNVASNFAEVEGSDIASSPHDIDDVFVNKDGKLLKATLAISIGDTIVIDTNCEPTTVEDLISYLSTQVSNLNYSNKKLNGITEIAVQTDLHTLSLGEYYKNKTSFYVTNGPEEIDEVASAIFRLTVESALNGLSTTRLITLKTPGGKVYTQNYDGSSWGDWEQVAFGSEVDLKQNITDNTLQTTSKTVPGAINELFLKSQAISNPNLLDNPCFTVNQRGANSYAGSTARVYTFDRWYISAYSPDLTVTDNNDGTITIANTGSSDNLQFSQLLESDLLISGKTYTLTCNVVAYTGSVRILFAGDVSPYPTIINKLVDKTGYVSGKGVYDGTSNTYKVSFSMFANSSITIRAVKIEFGEISTLASDTAPNYVTELMKCQRYYVRFKNSDNALPLAFGYLYQGNARVTCPLSVPMRDKPSFTFKTSASGGPTFTLASGDFATNISNFTIDTDDTHQRIIFIYPNITSSSTELAVLRLNVGVLLELSADL